VTLATVESCTAGSLAHLLSQAEGASETLHGGFVVHTKANKVASSGANLSISIVWVLSTSTASGPPARDLPFRARSHTIVFLVDDAARLLVHHLLAQAVVGLAVDLVKAPLFPGRGRIERHWQVTRESLR
jgi:hypothetical protein